MPFAANRIANPPGPDPKGLAVLRQLLQAGAEADEPSTPQGMTPLMAACRWRNLEAARLLLAAGAAPNRCMLEGPGQVTSLMLACDFEDVPWPGPGPAMPLVKLLIEAGADVNVQGYNGWTPLLLALNKEERQWDKLKGAADTVALLLASGADPNQCRTGDDWPPLLYCWGGETMQLLELAAARGNPRLLLPLVEYADLSSQSAGTLLNIYTCLCYGELSSGQALDLMRERGADPSWEPAEEDTSGHRDSK
ncbi:ankyrin repeat [Chlorella sorokiniana]|uniref:Ankyrin repeat n=1 Tax=Chlorella sorokiniana TaxID=3076 RepID=A0A2P6TPE5_CHLSO|nr:ankyrin repeat [Chlorella sorokiniana]|eukprot:PRW55904.1 ankyrin repeat [Chlorella sorokiniana]